MEDSLENYLKISKNNTEDPITIKKDVHVIAQKKQECDMRAMKIVEFSIEGKLRPEIFTRCLPYITRSHYQDIVEERAVTKLCGYSLCGKRIPEMPKKQYYISVKSNKVYDITDRKNYCSNFCYKASLHIKNQIDDSPVWLRKLDDIPEYQLLESGDGGLPGEVVDQGVVKPAAEPTFTPINMFTQATLQDIVENEVTKERITRKGHSKRITRTIKSTMQTIKENSEPVDDVIEDKLSTYHISKSINRKKESQQFISTYLPVINESEEKCLTACALVSSTESLQENPDIKTNTRDSRRKHLKTRKLDTEALLKKAVREWLTLESLIFVFGEDKVKQVLTENKMSSFFEELKIAELHRDQQIKYMEICKRLRLQEMADEKFDNAQVGDKKLNPVPDYKKLKEEGKDQNLKVKSFYSGLLHEKQDSNFPTKINKKGDDDQEEDPPAVLPLVDVNSQNAIRRKIFFSSVNKSVQQLIRVLRIESITTLSDLQNLVKTFQFTANNIVFKTFVWNYIAVILLNVLSLRDQKIKDVLQEKSSKECIKLFLHESSNKDGFISDIVTSIKNIDSFVEQYVSN